MDLSWKPKPPGKSATFRRHLNYHIVMTRREGYFALKRGDNVMSNRLFEMALRAEKLVDDIESGTIDPARAKIIMDSHKNVRESYKLLGDFLKMLDKDNRNVQASELLKLPVLKSTNSKTAN